MPETEIAKVVYVKSGCDYFILENLLGFIVAQHFSGADPEVGDEYIGDFNTFGLYDLYNQTQKSSSSLWLDDFMLSKDNAMEKIKDKCD